MTEKTVCSRCGKPAAGEDQIGLCNDCLLAVGLGSVVDATAAGRDARFVPPEVSEIAPYFPQLDISELLGCGGMGAVYKARQKNLDRLVALKILPPDIGSAPAFAERFAREAKALAKLNHPNIVTLYEFGQAGELFYFLMEYVDGVNLGQLLRSGRVSPREALAIVPQICDALQYAHDAGIVHRDIKPENILLDRKGRVKVADFGLAKLVGSASLDGTNGTNGTDGQGEVVTTTEAGHVMGTPQYMAPEQVAHPSDVDHRADIYSLGVVFYQMLTGELPKGDFVAPSKKVVVDVRLDEVVLRAMERRPELRYQQVSDVKTMVETIATTPPPASPPAASLRTGGAPVCERPDFISKLLLFSPIIGVRNGRRVIHWAGARSNGILSLGVMAVVFIPLALSGEHIYGWLVSLTLFVLGMIVAGIVRDCRKPIEQLPCLDEKEVSKNPPAFAVFGSLYGVLIFVLMASASWLPDRVACHFGLDGNADDWMGRVPYLLLIGAIPAVLALLFALVSRRIRTAGASFVNIPRRDYWLAPERRDRTAALIRDRLTWLLCLLSLFFGSLHVLTVAANRTSPPHLNMGALLVVVIVFLVAQMQWLFMLVMRFAEADDKCGCANSQALKKSAFVQTAPAASPTWRFPTMGWGHFIGYLQGITFTSPLAYKLANFSALGFLCFLGFMPLPGWKGFFGFSGIFGLIGLSTLIEMVARSKARRSCSNNQQPPRALDLNRWQGVLLLFGLILLSVTAFVVVLKQVISDRNPEVIQQTSGNQGTAFGPVVERVLPFDRSFIDFQTGKVLCPDLDKLHPTPKGGWAQWERQNGADALADEAPTVPVFGDKSFPRLVAPSREKSEDKERCVFVCEETDDFDSVLSSDADARLKIVTERNLYWGLAYGSRPWWFQTLDGAKGVLQILGTNDFPRGLKIRYKLVQGGAAKVAKKWLGNAPGLEITGPAIGFTQAQMQAWVEKWLATEYAGETYRSLEWGQPELVAPHDWVTIRYKFIMSSGDKPNHYYRGHRYYTFTKTGDFVRSDYADGPGVDMPTPTHVTATASLESATNGVATTWACKALVAEFDIASVDVGQEVRLTLEAFPKRVFHGKVTRVGNAPPVVAQNYVTYEAMIEIADPDPKFKAGMSANIMFVVAQREAAVPKSATPAEPRQVVAEWLRRINATTTNHEDAASEAIWELTTRSDSAAWSSGMEHAYNRVRPAHQLGNAERTMVLSATIKNERGEGRVFFANLLKRDGQWLINDHGFRSPAEVRERAEGFRDSPGVKFDVQAAELAGDWWAMCQPELTLAADGTGVEMLNKEESKPQALRWEVRGSTLRKHRPDREETWEITWIDDNTFAVHDSDSGLTYERKDDRQQALTDATNAKPAPAAVFGPVIEREVNDLQTTRENCALNFASGKLLPVPADITRDRLSNNALTKPPSQSEAEAWVRRQTEALAWAQSNQVDAIAFVITADGKLTQCGLLCPDVLAIPAEDSAWEQATPALLKNEFSRELSEWGFHSRVDELKSDGKFPATFLLLDARTHSQGVLQITGLTENLRGVKLRYKLVQGGTTNVAAIAKPPASK